MTFHLKKRERQREREREREGESLRLLPQGPLAVRDLRESHSVDRHSQEDTLIKRPHVIISLPVRYYSQTGGAAVSPDAKNIGAGRSPALFPPTL